VEADVFYPTFPSFLICLGVAANSNGPATGDAPGGPPSIVPEPVEIKIKAAPGAFVVTPATVIIADGPAAIEARKLLDAISPAMGLRLQLLENDQGRDHAIVLRIDDSLKQLGDEGYKLDVKPDRLVIVAAKPAGLFRGTQSLLQLLPPGIFRKAAVEGAKWTVPCVSITDYPRLRWRGLMLDTARHFAPKSFVLKLIDVMALYKFNSLQLHLTDDQGWRIEIKKYPKLTEVGAWRDETLIGHADKGVQKFDGRRHGGYYTQDDIREIVRYAADRYINVVPEIEMPGHARAAVAAYPELGCNPDKPVRPWTVWGVCPDIFVPTDRTISFLQDVLSEVIELFPSRFIHIGGDEAIKDQWKASPVVQARIKELGLKDEAEMQSWFIKQMDTFLTQKGRRLVGWDEILEGGLAPGAVVMSWRGEKGGIAAARAGHDVVMAPTSFTYFDYYQGPHDKEPLAIGGDLPLKKVYQYEPIPKELDAAEAKRVLGAQGQLWAEYMPNTRHIEYMAFPRAAALAEVLWSPQQARDYTAFLARLRVNLKDLDVMDVNYRRLDKE
jgi:hexosaminidase